MLDRLTIETKLRDGFNPAIVIDLDGDSLLSVSNSSRTQQDAEYAARAWIDCHARRAS